MPRKSKKKAKVYSWDFETTTDPNDCRVWAWGSVELDDLNNYEIGVTLDSFMEFISRDNCRGTFHNLKFDGEFIIYWLLTHDFVVVKSDKNMPHHSFYTQISDKGQFYKLVIKFEKTRCSITDSYKVLPFSVDDIAKYFNLPISKLSIDYDAVREPGHRLTSEETEYLLHDIKIMAMALNIVHSAGLHRMTIGGNALNDYKQSISKDKFDEWFPQVRDDKFIRNSYKGGFTYVNPMFANKVVGKGIVLDVNSLYPYVMWNVDNPYPYGEPIYYKGPYQPDDDYPLYVQRIMVNMKLKRKHIPTIQIKNSYSGFIPTEYITSTKDEVIELTLTCVDLKLLFDQYDIIDIAYIDGYKFKAMSGMFTDYINHWTQIKVQATIDGNLALRTVAKLMLNNLYGKFATSPKGGSKWPELVDGKVRYVNGERERRETIYIPVGTFVTSYARNLTIRSAQSVYDRFIYADTDSLHLVGTDIPEGLKVHPSELGAWKHESTFARAKFIRAKTYMEEEIIQDNRTQWKITCAGMPKECHSQVSLENFKMGARYAGKLLPRHVKGGIVLQPTTFEIRA